MRARSGCVGSIVFLCGYYGHGAILRSLKPSLSFGFGRASWFQLVRIASRNLHVESLMVFVMRSNVKKLGSPHPTPYVGSNITARTLPTIQTRAEQHPHQLDRMRHWNMGPKWPAEGLVRKKKEAGTYSKQKSLVSQVAAGSVSHVNPAGQENFPPFTASRSHLTPNTMRNYVPMLPNTMDWTLRIVCVVCFYLLALVKNEENQIKDETFFLLPE